MAGQGRQPRHERQELGQAFLTIPAARIPELGFDLFEPQKVAEWMVKKGTWAKVDGFR